MDTYIHTRKHIYIYIYISDEGRFKKFKASPKKKSHS